MPYYTFRNKITGETFDEQMTISEADEYEERHPEWERMCGAPRIGDSVRLGLKKPDDGFRDRLREIKKKHPLGKGINTF